MDWTQTLDIYCERLNDGLLAEPANAFSNLAFFATTALIVRRLPAQAPSLVRALAWLPVAIGTGSLVFHTVATRWASVLDIAFIAVFVLAYLAYAPIHLLGWPVRRAVLGVSAVVGLTAATAVAPRLPAMNGSEIYLGTWLAMATLAATGWRVAAGRGLIAATSLFAVSIALRSIDMLVCASFPLGTHFGWHLCNAVVLWCALRALLDDERGVTPVGRPAP